MTKLAEGMTRNKTQHGTVFHTYRNVNIWKHSRGYEFSIEYMQAETGRVFNRDRYAAYQLQNVPSDIDSVLDETDKYFVDAERGIVRLNEDYLEHMRIAAIERIENEIAAMTAQIASLLAAQNFIAVEKGAQTLVKLQTQLLTIKSHLE